MTDRRCPKPQADRRTRTRISIVDVHGNSKTPQSADRAGTSAYVIRPLSRGSVGKRNWKFKHGKTKNAIAQIEKRIARRPDRARWRADGRTAFRRDGLVDVGLGRRPSPLVGVCRYFANLNRQCDTTFRYYSAHAVFARVARRSRRRSIEADIACDVEYSIVDVTERIAPITRESKRHLTIKSSISPLWFLVSPNRLKNTAGSYKLQ